ncbi:MAG: NUDIX hydrolase [Ignavibacteriae bacterium]|nr:NUDIX hydrolase [Ignavibacteriota bacterium]
MDEYILPDGNKGDYYYVETPGAVMVIPRLDDGRIVMIRQYRYLNSKFSLEFPGGGIKPGLSVKDNALKELSEEAGFESHDLQKIGEFNPFNGVTNEICNVFIADKLTKVKSNPDNSEEFDIVYLDKNQVADLIRSNEIWDGMTLSAWSLYVYSKYWS